MLIIGCDFHPGFQQVAIFDNRRGEMQEKRLKHCEEAERFYRSLSGPVRVGMELPQDLGAEPGSARCAAPGSPYTITNPINIVVLPKA